MKRIQIAILDDNPVTSGLPKLSQVGFMNSAFDSKWDSIESLGNTLADDSYGVSLRSVTPQELSEAHTSEWEHTIFFVDVNWHEIPPDTPGFEDMSMENKKSYGVELAEEIFSIRDHTDNDSIHVIFFSNSRQDLVDEEVRRWKREGVPNVEALFLGAGQYSAPKIVDDTVRAYESILALILRGIDLHEVSPIMAAVCQAEDLVKKNPSLKLELKHFVGEEFTRELKGFRLGDLALPFLNYAEQCGTGEALKRWKRLFDAQFFQVPFIGLKKDVAPNEASLVLQSFLRYGQRGQLDSQSKRLAPKGTVGLTFADIYLVGAELIDSIKLIDPVMAVESWRKQGLETSSKASGEWNFFFLLNHCLSTNLGKLDAKNTGKSVPSIFGQEGFFSVERKGWDPDAHLRIAKSGSLRPAIHWSLEIDPMIYLECPHVDSQLVADRFRKKNCNLEQVERAWSEDRQHLELLELLADNLDDVVNLNNFKSYMTELGESFLAAKSQLDYAIERFLETEKLLYKCEMTASEHLDDIDADFSSTAETDDSKRAKRKQKTPKDRIVELQAVFKKHGLSRIDGWKELSELFGEAAYECHVDEEPSFGDKYGSLLNG